MTDAKTRHQALLRAIAKKDAVKLSEEIEAFRAGSLDLDEARHSGSKEGPLHATIRSKWLEGAGMLLDAGASPDSADLLGRSAFLLAIETGLAEMCSLLGARGADPNLASQQERGGFSALDRALELAWASRQGDSSMLDALLAIPGVDLERLDREGATPLGRAAGMGDSLVIAKLLAAGSEPTALGKEGLRPIEAAALHGHGDAARQLLEHCSEHSIPVDLNKPWAGGSNLLCAAIMGQSATAITALLEFGARLPEPLPGAFQTLRDMGMPLPGLDMAREWLAAHELRSELLLGLASPQTAPRRPPL